MPTHGQDVSCRCRMRRCTLTGRALTSTFWRSGRPERLESSLKLPAMAQFAPPPPQFASAPGDGKPPLVPMKPMLPVGADQPQQQQPIWASSSSKRDRRRQVAPAATQQPVVNGTGASLADEPPAQAAPPVAEPGSWLNGSSATQPVADPVLQWTAEPEAAVPSQHSPHKRQREGPQDDAAAATQYASEDAQAQQWDHVQPTYEQLPPEAAMSGDAAASARQRLQQLEHDVAPLVQQRAEVRCSLHA